jgi:enoyl-CoA hydratase/carnithine racemase
VTSRETVTVAIDGSVAVVSLNRPDRHNAFTDEMDAAFFDALDELAGRDDVRAVVWRGEGKSFSSGRDTAELGQRSRGQSDYEFIAAGHARTRLLFTFPVPIVVALKGWVLGGSFERALLCDLRIAADDARMALPEVGHGVIPDSGGVARLFQMAGHGVAADLALTGRVIDADEALRHGIVSRVVSAGDLDTVALEIAGEIASRSPLAVQMTRGVLGSLATKEVEGGMHEELLAQTMLFGSEDYQELKAAKAEGREPKFRGR